MIGRVTGARRRRPRVPPIHRPGRVGPLVWALAGGLVRCVAWGFTIGVSAGAAAGTVIVPVVGTLAGGYVGARVAVLPTVVGAAVVLARCGLRHRVAPDPVAVTREVGVVVRGLVVVLVAIALVLDVRLVLTGPPDTPIGVLLWINLAGAAAGAVTWWLAGVASESIAQGWCRSWAPALVRAGGR